MRTLSRGLLLCVVGLIFTLSGVGWFLVGDTRSGLLNSVIGLTCIAVADHGETTDERRFSQ